MFSKFIITIAICSVLQAIVSIIAPESDMKNIVLSITNVIFSSIIFTEILEIINNLL